MRSKMKNPDNTLERDKERHVLEETRLDNFGKIKVQIILDILLQMSRKMCIVGVK